MKLNFESLKKLHTLLKFEFFPTTPCDLIPRGESVDSWYGFGRVRAIKQNYETEKRQMLEQDLRGRGIRNEALLKAFQDVPREKFVLPEYLVNAYDDRPLPLGYGATISQPYVVAKTIEEARIHPGDAVLEIGTGSGYQTAILSTLGASVFSIEVIPELSIRSQGILNKLGCNDIQFWIGDGSKGWPEDKEFDAILLSAAPEQISQLLLNQLKVNGILVGPEGVHHGQWLVRIERTVSGFKKEKILPVRFVAMIST